MSYNKNTNNKNTNNNKIAPKKYCKVCHDAGKPESEYLSHFIRENPHPNSKIVCPTLLSLECRYCSKRGHTVKYCKILEKEKNAESRQEHSNKYRAETIKNEVKCKNNIFENLESDSEEEDEKQESQIRFSEPVSNIKSYASVLSTPVPKAAEMHQEEAKCPIYKTFDFEKYAGRSWADTDTESDDDDDNNDPNW